MPTVSVIIPAFNAAGTLNATLASVFAQTYQDWEAIIVDDGSTDFTASNALTWCNRDPRFRFIPRKHLGPSAARNEGVLNARWPWLLFLDADDLIAPDHLEYLVAETIAHPDAGLIYCGSAKIAMDGRIGAAEMPPAGQYFERLAVYNLFSIHSCLVRRDLFNSIGGFDPDLLTCEDWDVWQRLARTGAKFVPAKGGLALYRMRATSLSHRAEVLFDGARTVITRGHGPDPRISTPAPAYANGAPAEKLPHALMCFALWCSGLLIGAGRDPSDFLLKAPLTEIDDVDTDRPVSVIQGSVPAGACGLQEDWPKLWPKFRLAIYDAYTIVEQRSSVANFANRCIEELEARLNLLWPGLPDLSAQPDEPPAEEPARPPAVGQISFGDFWRLKPIGTEWGYDRGDPIDRLYVEDFLQRHSKDIKGRVLEVGDNAYTRRFGGNRVEHSDVLHINPGSKEATIIADLATADHIQSNLFDCIILTQTLHLVFDLHNAVRNLERILKPGGTLLLTVPGISQIDHGEWAGEWHWSMTVHSVRRLLADRFPRESVSVESRGNVLSATAFLQGLSQQDVGAFAFEADDPHYPLTVLARATKPTMKLEKKAPPPAAAKTQPGKRKKPLKAEPPIILMYHRVNTPTHDPWLLHVSPENLSAQLQLLTAERDVVPISWLVSKLNEGNLPQGTACVTFDDGYADVLYNGRPVLEQYKCPATMFLAPHYIGSGEGYWWDILARIMFETGNLPPQLTLTVAGTDHVWRLRDPAGNPADDALSLADLHLAIWKLLKPLETQERLALLEKLALWAGTDAAARSTDRTVSLEEVSRLIEPGFIDVGAHSQTHPSLPALGREEMQREIVASRKACEELSGMSVNAFAYPFGDVDEATASAVRAAGFDIACTTIGGAVALEQDRMLVPRIFVGNWAAEEFDRKVLYSHQPPASVQ